MEPARRAKVVTWEGRVGEPWSAVPRCPILELVAPALAAHDSPVVIFDDGTEISGPALLAAVERFAGALAQVVSSGDRVLLACGNRVEYLIAYFAIVACRGVVVAVGPDVRAHDAEHALRKAGCVLAVAEQSPADEIAKAGGRCPDLRDVIAIAGSEPDGLEHACSGTEPLQLGDVRASIDDLIDIGFTSGTTGLPKALAGDHTELLRYVDVALRSEPPTPDERTLLGLQFHYGDPLYSTVAAILSGTSVIVMRRFSVSRFWRTAKRFRATRIVTIGSIPSLLLAAPGSPEDRDHEVRSAIAVGIPRGAHAELEDRFGFPWREAYGSSESGPAIAMPPEVAARYVGSGALGVPYPDINARLVDPDGEVLEGTATGELELSGAILFHGYLNNQEATAEVMHDGWFRTGDIMRRDEDGVYYFDSRRKDLIRRGGENIAPAEVEAVLRQHPGVVDAAVVAVDDPIHGEESKAYVEVRDGEELDPAELAAFCGERLTRFKVPRYFETRRQPFPRTPSQRIRKEALKIDGRHSLKGCWDGAKQT